MDHNEILKVKAIVSGCISEEEKNQPWAEALLEDINTWLTNYGSFSIGRLMSYVSKLRAGIHFVALGFRNDPERFTSYRKDADANMLTTDHWRIVVKCLNKQGASEEFSREDAIDLLEKLGTLVGKVNQQLAQKFAN